MPKDYAEKNSAHRTGHHTFRKQLQINYSFNPFVLKLGLD